MKLINALTKGNVKSLIATVEVGNRTVMNSTYNISIENIVDTEKCISIYDEDNELIIYKDWEELSYGNPGDNIEYTYIIPNGIIYLELLLTN